MEGSDGDFPGFQTLVPKEDNVKVRPPLSRLQRRAPCPLQVKPAISLECKAAAVKSAGYNGDSSALSSSSTTSSFGSCYHSKDPIPLLSPLVLPSLLESAGYVHGENNTAKSH